MLEIYFEIHRGGTPRGEDFTYYDSMPKCIVTTIPLVSKNNKCVVFRKNPVENDTGFGQRLRTGQFCCL